MSYEKKIKQDLENVNYENDRFLARAIKYIEDELKPKYENSTLSWIQVKKALVKGSLKDVDKERKRLIDWDVLLKKNKIIKFLQTIENVIWNEPMSQELFEEIMRQQDLLDRNFNLVGDRKTWEITCNEIKADGKTSILAIWRILENGLLDIKRMRSK